MAADSDADAATSAIDTRLAAWRQGDCSVDEDWFAYRVGQAHPITDAGRIAVEGGADLAEQLVPGFVVVTQTCDIVRSCVVRPCVVRPFVEVCPLVQVEEAGLREVQRRRRPAYAFVPLLAERRLVADLDRVMTVEKPVVAGWERTPGWTTDAEARAFALALSRSRASGIESPFRMTSWRSQESW